MRKLATIRKVDKLIPIKNKQRIELAVIGGWSCIVKKGEFTEGSTGVFFEIDSFLPVTPTFEFLGKPITHQGKQGYRIRTLKMAGAISQGLMLPLNMFEDYGSEDTPTPTEGTDLTEILGVTKYDVDLANGQKSQTQVTGQPKGKFPSFIPKTDQERIQNLPHYFEVCKDMEFEETLKLDGSSCTMYKIKQDLPWYTKLYYNLIGKPLTHFGVCSRNLELTRPTSTDKKSNFWEAAYMYNIEKNLPEGYAIQGEVLAPNIQGNYERLDGINYYIFNVYNINTQKYLTPDDAEWFVLSYLPDAKYVPIINRSVKIFNECTSYEELFDRVDDKSINPTVISEGRVYKSTDGSVTFKCINNKYLLKSKK